MKFQVMYSESGASPRLSIPHSIASPSFKRFLAYQHYQAHKKMLAQSALDDLRRIYEGQAIFDGEEHPVFNRIGNLNRNLYVHLGSQDWKAVSINAEGWQVIDQGRRFGCWCVGADTL